MKDWKGNSNSARAALMVKSPKSKNEREQDDFYATDPVALEMLLDNCSKDLKKEFYNCEDSWLQKVTADVQLIWEPAAGTGNLSDYLHKRNYKVVASDLKYRGAKNVVEGIDFLSVKDYKQKFKGATPRIILTNPPYSLATEFIEHALEILPDGGLYIALMNISYLAGKERFNKVYVTNQLREVYIFSSRINVWKNNIPTPHSSMCNFAWYVFQKGYNQQPVIYWL